MVRHRDAGVAVPAHMHGGVGPVVALLVQRAAGGVHVILWLLLQRHLIGWSLWLCGGRGGKEQRGEGKGFTSTSGSVIRRLRDKNTPRPAHVWTVEEYVASGFEVLTVGAITQARVQQKIRFLLTFLWHFNSHVKIFDPFVHLYFGAVEERERLLLKYEQKTNIKVYVCLNLI